MNTEITKIELLKKQLTPVWGGMNVDLIYCLETANEKDNTKNKYFIYGTLRGLDNPNEIYFEAITVIAVTNNQNTLTIEGLEELTDWQFIPTAETRVGNESEELTKIYKNG